MGSFSGLGIVLSLVFGCILFGLVGEVYYLLWWKKKNTNREMKEHYIINHAKQILHNSLCWKRTTSLNNSSTNSTQELTSSVRNNNPDVVIGAEPPDLELGSGKDLLLKGFGEDTQISELMRLHNLCGPPRFLFTIKEETKEDLESDDGKSRSRIGSRTRSLSDLILAVENFSSSSPSSKSPHPTLDTYNNHGFNPLFESSTDAELNRVRSSPPPKFKFLRDAEEKLMRRLKEEAEKKALKNGGCVVDSTMVTEERSDGGSVIKIVVGKNRERETHHQLPQHQVLPLASSPSPLQHQTMLQC
ncbi:uncharacterized protein LOC132269459 [Cornus florida]|uniref:uncharacterized protein LOC132269459 n=1 Tax=Cornus florida TaxID=4283 RepID=UPI00289F0282|nr:uncharacterized protein LOC132269459 [Cornus florida]